jgi:hypothetical protein
LPFAPPPGLTSPPRLVSTPHCSWNALFACIPVSLLELELAGSGHQPGPSHDPFFRSLRPKGTPRGPRMGRTPVRERLG